MVRFSFSGHDLVALPQAALFWPARKALLVADLHFEKASWFARFGQMLPPYDSDATLADLEALVAATDARELWCLGDSFHDSAGSERMSAKARDTLASLTERIDWTWITGNHDEAIPTDHGGRVIEEAEVDGLLLRHEADPAEARPELSPLPSKAAYPYSRQKRFASLLRGDRSQADPARIWSANWRP